MFTLRTLCHKVRIKTYVKKNYFSVFSFWDSDQHETSNDMNKNSVTIKDDYGVMYYNEALKDYITGMNWPDQNIKKALEYDPKCVMAYCLLGVSQIINPKTVKQPRKNILSFDRRHSIH